MIDPKIVNDLSNKLSQALPASLKEVKEYLQKNFCSILQGGLNKLDLVTREEFDTQKAVLAKTRAKLDDIETIIKSMEGDD